MRTFSTTSDSCWKLLGSDEANWSRYRRKGMKDDEIAVLLRQQRYTTFFTCDKDFYWPELRH